MSRWKQEYMMENPTRTRVKRKWVQKANNPIMASNEDKIFITSMEEKLLGIFDLDGSGTLGITETNGEKRFKPLDVHWQGKKCIYKFETWAESLFQPISYLNLNANICNIIGYDYTRYRTMLISRRLIVVDIYELEFYILNVLESGEVEGFIYNRDRKPHVVKQSDSFKTIEESRLKEVILELFDIQSKGNFKLHQRNKLRRK